jgi:hypothetical protein
MGLVRPGAWIIWWPKSSPYNKIVVFQMRSRWITNLCPETSLAHAVVLETSFIVIYRSRMLSNPHHNIALFLLVNFVFSLPLLDWLIAVKPGIKLVWLYMCWNIWHSKIYRTKCANGNAHEHNKMSKYFNERDSGQQLFHAEIRTFWLTLFATNIHFFPLVECAIFNPESSVNMDKCWTNFHCPIKITCHFQNLQACASPNNKLASQ